MMGKAKSCVGGFSIFNYFIDEKKGFELLRNGVCGETPVEIFQEFKIIQDQNQKATNKLFSLVLSPQIADGEKLSKKEFREIAKDYLEDLGFDTRQDQFIAFCHLEKKHRHIQILLNRVSTDARLKSDHFIGKRAQWAAHRVAEKHGLVSAKKMMVDKIRKAEKSPAKIARKSIFEKHLAVMQYYPTTFKEYSNLMKNLDIELLPTINKKGQLQGLRVKDLGSGEEYKASDIHKLMGLKNILEAGLLMDANQKMFEATQHLAEEKNAILSAIDKKTSQIANYRPNITYSVPELENFKADQAKLLQGYKNEIDRTFETNIRTLNSEFKRNKDNKGKLYLLIAFCILTVLNFCFLSYGLNQHSQKNQFEEKAHRYYDNSAKALEFIREKKIRQGFQEMAG